MSEAWVLTTARNLNIIPEGPIFRLLLRERINSHECDRYTILASGLSLLIAEYNSYLVY